MSMPHTRAPRRRARNTRRWVRRAVLAPFPLVLSLLVPSTTAWAAGSGDTGNGDGGGDVWSYLSSPFQPIARWANATAFFHYTADGGLIGVSLASIVRWFESMQMATTNLLWQLAQWLVSVAHSFNLLSGGFGQSMDQTVGAIGGAITGGAPGTTGGPVILVIMVLVALGVALVASFRQRNGALFLKRAVGIAVITGLFTLMVTQASAGSMSGAAYRPAAMSPVWVGTQVTGLVDKVTSGFSSIVAGSSFGSSQITSTSTDDSSLSCGREVSALARQLAAQPDVVGGDGGALQAVNDLYISTAASAYAVAQYGSNPYGYRVWCRSADYQSTLTTTTQSQLTAYAGVSSTAPPTSGASASEGGPGWLGTAKTDDGSGSRAAAFGDNHADNSTFDKEIIAWAACHPYVDDASATDASAVTFKIDDGWASITGAAVTQLACKSWWTSDGGSNLGAPFSTIAGWSASDVGKNVSNPTVATFINALHGTDNGILMQGLVATSVASFGSLTNAGIIGGLSLGNIIAKVMLMFLLFLTAFVLLKGMFTSGPIFRGIGDHLKAIFGVALFVVGLGLIVALVMLFSSLLSKAGSYMLGGSGSVFSILWTAACPVLAVLGLHFIFKRLGLPSPVTITGGAAWANMLTRGGAAAAGGAVAGGMAARAQQAGSRVGRGAAGSVKGAVSGRGRGSAAHSGGTGAASAGGVNSASAVGRRSSAMSQARLERAKRAAQKRLESQQAGVTAARGGRVGAGARKIGAWAAQGAGKLGSAAGKTRLGQTIVGAARHARSQAQYLANTRAGQVASRTGRTALNVSKRAASVTRRVVSTRAAQVAGRAALVGGSTVLAGPVGLVTSTAGIHAARYFAQRRAERKQAVADELERLNVGQKPAAEPAPGAERPQRIRSHQAGRSKKRA